MSKATGSVGEIIGAFISAIFGLALAPTVGQYATSISSDTTNFSEIVRLVAPYIPLFWVLGCMGIAGMLMYKYFQD